MLILEVLLIEILKLSNKLLMQNRQVVIFSDFDGTMVSTDMAFKMLEYFEGEKSAEEWGTNLSNAKVSISDLMEHICSLMTTFESTSRTSSLYSFLSMLVQKYRITIDPFVKQFLLLVQREKINFKILSGGFKKVIQHFLHLEDSEIMSHDFQIKNSEFHFVCNSDIVPKGKYISQNFPQDKFKVIFIGDGVSDFSVIGKCDLILAKKNSILDAKCSSEHVPYKVYRNFGDVIEILTEERIF